MKNHFLRVPVCVTYVSRVFWSPYEIIRVQMVSLFLFPHVVKTDRGGRRFDPLFICRVPSMKTVFAS